ncbi:MAG: YqgE/AlgH family protein [Gammaproteobacteria bacterium]|nr:YqgE/AlgH family protein [Gammaproteobacteria bacterium]MBU1654863.1 YqgE/AlgH family protein [Gammaproteobacteria bacterium]MBU1961154.1 YqgE/AlgH family protein [Gammaproteobacteria bacterium]
MTREIILTNHFLCAMPGLQDPNFARSLTYLCEHSDQGAMGIIINRPMDLKLGDIFEQLSISAEDEVLHRIPVYQGGPVQAERGFVLHDDNHSWDSTLSVAPGVSITTSRDILEAIAQNRGPARFLMALGYAGWGAGQLAQELSHNAWLSGPADRDIIFSTPAEQRLIQAAACLGVNLNLISSEAGHA